MTPPIGHGGTGNSPPAPDSTPSPNYRVGIGTERPPFLAAPTLELRTDIRNPILTESSRRIATLGDVREAIIEDFFGGQLREGTRGVQVVQQLGSFPGFRHPNRPLNTWNPDQKPDFNLVGESDVILRLLAPKMGWDEATLQANIERAREGMVYFNQAIETPVGPVPFKMGILDTQLWRDGHFYFDMRASLLPFEDTYRFMNQGGRRGTITRDQFLEVHRQREADLIGRTLNSFLFRRGFNADQFAGRRYRHNFGHYERYRVFDWFKGSSQRRKYQTTSQGNLVPQILVPGLTRWLEENPSRLRVTHPELGELRPAQITPENFSDLQFRWNSTFSERLPIYLRDTVDFFRINAANWRQTRLNIASNATSRPSHHSIGWVAYGKRKFGRFFGMSQQLHPRTYTPESSHFLDIEGLSAQAQRLGYTQNPIDQMIILAGYGPRDERDPAVWEEIVSYTEAEIGKGAKPNILIRGNNPSKFTFPLGGAPVISYRLMDGMRAEGIKTIVVVGPPDVGATVEAFQEHFAEEIRSRGKRIIYVDTGLGQGGFTINLRQGQERLPNPEKIALLSPGDTPRVDLINVAHHPWRHNIDYVFGNNGRDMVLDFMGMNAHVQADLDGVAHATKEGNLQAVKSNFPDSLWREMFENRKSVKRGVWPKVEIGLRYLFLGKNGTTYRPQWSTLAKLFHPSMSSLDVFGLILGDIAPRSIRNVLHRKMSQGRARPPFAAMNVEAVEDLFRNRLEWNADFRVRHLDPACLLDVDGIRDYIVAEIMSQRHPYRHRADLDQFVQQTLGNYTDRIPAFENTPQRINDIYLRLREDLLDREAHRPTEAKLGITDETLRRLGFDPDVLPFGEDGQINQQWVERVLPQQDLENFRRAFVAYDNRGQHAESLAHTFQEWHRQTRPLAENESINPKVENFVLTEINANPERMRALVLEWEFDRVERAVLERASNAFGNHAGELDEIRNYFELSTAGHGDTRLRSVLLGLKGVDVLRRYQPHLSPAEFQELFPWVVESLHEAQSSSPPHQTLKKGPIPHLSQLFARAQNTADQIFVRKVGESPPPYRARGRVASRLPHSNARMPVHRVGDQIRSVDSPVYLQRDLNLLAKRLEILPSRIPEIIAAASGANSPETLNLISGEGEVPGQRRSFHRLLEWTQGVEGQNYLRSNGPRIRDNFRNRWVEGGPGLGVGIMALLGAEYAADKIGLDPVKNSHERFMMVVGAGHVFQAGFSNFQEVAMNRFLHHTPYQFTTTRMVQAGGEAGVQYSFQAGRGGLRALGASTLRNFGGGSRSLVSLAGRGAWGLGTMPIRAGWNMGPGLMASTLTDKILSERILGLAADDPTRQWIHFGAFFAPDLYRLTFGTRGAAFLRSRPMRFASRAFAVGFLADLAFTGVNRISNGSDGATRMSMVYQRANELNDEANGSGLLDGALELVAPQVSAWWDSVEFKNGWFRPNHFHEQAQQELDQFSRGVHQNATSMLQGRLLRGSGSEAQSEEFYTQVDLDFLRGSQLENRSGPSGNPLPHQLWREDLEMSPEIRNRFAQLAGRQEQIQFIQRRYSGWNLSEADAETLLEETVLSRTRGDLAQLSALPYRSESRLQNIFDQDGHLEPGQDAQLYATLFDGQVRNESDLLRARREFLLARIEHLQSHPEADTLGELDGLTQVAHQIGVL